MPPSRTVLLLAAILPAAAAGAVYEYFLGHRHDYAGHSLVPTLCVGTHGFDAPRLFVRSIS